MSQRYTVYLTAGAEADLADIHDWIAAHRAPDQADALLERLLVG